MILRLRWFVLSIWVVAGLSSCGAPPGPIPEPSPEDPCAGVSCNQGRCEVQAGQPVCVCRETTDPGCSPAPKPPTSIQPSSTPTEAQLEASASGDVARFTFAPEAGHYYRFTCTRKTLPSCTVKVLDDRGAVFAASTSPTAESVVVTYQSVGTQPLFVEVSAAPGSGGTYTYQLQDLGMDDAGNTPQEASPRTPSAEPFTGTVNSSGDDDMYSFPVAQGHIYRFSCSVPLAPSGGWILRLLDAQGQKVDEANSWDELALTVAAKAQRAEPWYAQLLFSDDGFIDNYTCTIEDMGPDDHGDSVASATPITGASGTIQGHLELRLDVDAFALATLPGHYYGITCSHSGTLDCQQAIPGVTGERVRRGINLSTFYFKASGTGPVPILISATGEPLAYALQIEDLGLDDHGDSAASATPRVPSSEPIQGVIEAPIDRDVFAFTAEAGHVYQLLCAATPDQEAWALEFHDAAGNQLDVAQAGYGITSVVSAAITTPGTYTVAVFSRAASSPRSGAYSCRLEDLGPDDHGDTLSTATAVTPTVTVPGRLETRQDMDVFSFNALAGHTYRVTCKPGTYSNFCFLRLKNASGTVLHPQQQTFLQQTATQDETWFVELEGERLSLTLGTYSLEFKDFGVDDHGDTPATATPITPGSTASGFHSSASDLDVFTFPAPAGTIYRVTCQTCTVEFRDATGPVTRILKSVDPYTYDFKAPATEPLFLVTSSSGGTYTLELRETGHDDYGDTLATAAPLTLGEHRLGNIELVFDKDVFSLNLAAGEAHVITLGSTMLFTATVLAPDGTTVPTDAAGHFTTGAAGTYFIQVASNATPQSFPTGTYGLTVE